MPVNTLKSTGTQTATHSEDEEDELHGKIQKNLDRIIEKVASLEPSQESMEFFSEKILQYEREQELFKQKLEKYMKISNDRNQLEIELLKRGDKIAAMQKALRELQDLALKERQKVNTLEAEILKHKTKEDECHLRIQELLKITKDTPLHDSIVYIFDRPYSLNIYEREVQSSANEQQTKVKQVVGDTGFPEYRFSAQTERDTISLLKNQIEDLHKLFAQQTMLTEKRIDSMLKDCSSAVEETEVQNQQLKEKIRFLIRKLKVTEDDLKVSTCELVDSTKTLRRQEILLGLAKSIPDESTSSEVASKDTQTVGSGFRWFTMGQDAESTNLRRFQTLKKKPLLSSEIKPVDKQMFKKVSKQTKADEPEPTTITLDITDPKVPSFIHSEEFKKAQIAKKGQKAQTLDPSQSAGKFIHARPGSHPSSRIKLHSQPSSSRSKSAVSLSKQLFLKRASKSQKSAYKSSSSVSTAAKRSTPHLENTSSMSSILHKRWNAQTARKTLSKPNKLSLKKRSDEGLSEVRVVRETGSGGRISSLHGEVEISEDEPGRSASSSVSTIGKKSVATAVKTVDTEEEQSDDQSSTKDFISEKSRARFRPQQSESFFIPLDEENAAKSKPQKYFIPKDKEQHIDHDLQFSQKKTGPKELTEHQSSECQLCRSSSDPTPLSVSPPLQNEPTTFQRKDLISSRSLKEALAEVALLEEKISSKLNNTKRTLRRTGGLFQGSESDEEQPKKLFDRATQTKPTSAFTVGIDMTNETSPSQYVDILHLVSHKGCEEQIDALTEKLRKQASDLQDMQRQAECDRLYARETHARCRNLEEQLQFERDHREAYIRPYKEQNKTLIEQLKLSRSQLQRLDEYRRLEVEGFQTDIRNLVDRIRIIERQMMKALIDYERGEKDMELLKTVHKGTKQSEKVTNEVKRLKAKLYQIENDMKNMF